jgi:hypothetical protein
VASQSRADVRAPDEAFADAISEALR